MYSLAIVGLGPRGLYALESLFVTLSRKRHKIIPKVALIESQTEIGCGSAWSIHQPDANTINISDRDLVELPEREIINGDGYLITAFPSFIDWVRDNYNHELDDNKDTYFERNVMGRYLHQRARTIIDPLIKQDVVTLIKARATSLKIVDKITEIDFENDQHQSIHVQHTLLTTGRTY
ncbi:MAG: FAD/NAD(P)-binding protein, partial [Nonlabens ulvanivorans]|uniref:FAD/NAD(P)-binding protein n=1 Tax=Nonlabens ulvanivorans TaxID=906888 RepID=UPI003265E90A